MALETKEVLITVKAPPTPSKKHQETNCCAGIDLKTGQLIRLYPIPFRLLDDSQKFPKYSIINVKCKKPIRDKRLESYEIDADSIEIFDHLDTKNDKRWERRKEIVLPAKSTSFCQIFDDIKHKKSLGFFKPTDISFESKKTYFQNNSKAAYCQLQLFNKKLKPIEPVPYKFYYKFKCFDDSNCRGHILKIHDWEINAAYHKWKTQYKSTIELIAKIKEKWLTICDSKKDVYFFVGNQWRHPTQFMILGVFYPPKSERTLFT